MCETIKELLALGIVPVCNENGERHITLFCCFLGWFSVGRHDSHTHTDAHSHSLTPHLAGGTADVFYSNTSSRDFMMSHQNTSIATFNPNFRGDPVDDSPEGASKVVRLTANDSLCALLAVELDADLMVSLHHHHNTSPVLP